jgi:putative two-component system response regulator
VAEYRDEETGDHVVRVGCYSRVIAEELEADREFVEMLFLTSPLHDIGKIGVPDAVLLKPGPLSEDEWEVMKQHCAIGADILRKESKVRAAFLAWHGGQTYGYNGNGQNPVLKMASSIAMTHHEWWDGSGYPGGLAGKDIPLHSRIAALADAYDALSFDRSYRPALSESDVLQTIRDEVGDHFDPKVHAAFEQSIPQLRAIRIRLEDEVCGTTG